VGMRATHRLCSAHIVDVSTSQPRVCLASDHHIFRRDFDITNKKCSRFTDASLCCNDNLISLLVAWLGIWCSSFAACHRFITTFILM
jgi:hypothetical protein